MIHGLIITTLICLGVSNNLGAVDNTAPIFNQDINTTIKEPSNKIDVVDGKYTYEFNTTYSKNIEHIGNWPLEWTEGGEDPIYTSLRYDAQATNEIFSLKTNTYENILTWRNTEFEAQSPRDAWILAYPDTTTKFTATAILEIYQITPYKATYDNKLKITIRNNIINNFGSNLKLRKITYITTNNLSSLLDNTTFNTVYWIGQKEQMLYNPILGYNYTKNEEIITYEQYSEEIPNIRPQDNTTTYELDNEKTSYILNFYYLDPRIQNGQTPSNPLAQFYTYNRYLFINYTDLTMSGNFIPPVANYEVVDIPNFIFTILTLPFSFISVAFNLTLFPGTMYQINLANLFLAIIGILVFIFVIGLLIKKH